MTEKTQIRIATIGTILIIILFACLTSSCSITRPTYSIVKVDRCEPDWIYYGVDSVKNDGWVFNEGQEIVIRDKYSVQICRQ